LNAFTSCCAQPQCCKSRPLLTHGNARFLGNGALSCCQSRRLLTFALNVLQKWVAKGSCDSHPLQISATRQQLQSLPTPASHFIPCAHLRTAGPTQHRSSHQLEKEPARNTGPEDTILLFTFCQWPAAPKVRLIPAQAEGLGIKALWPTRAESPLHPSRGLSALPLLLGSGSWGCAPGWYQAHLRCWRIRTANSDG
jgi:hypothetical protein